ncbi:hypothetical protein JCM11491_002743 [Sporobolomyces phaffii]
MATKPEHLERVLAPVLVGSVLSCISAGLVLSLATTYFTRFNSDAAWIKAAVLGLTVLGLAGSGFDVSWLYNWSVTNFLRPENLSTVPWELSGYHFLNGLIVAVVQHIYLFRCWIASGRSNLLLVVVVSTISMASFGVSTYLTVLSSQHRELTWPTHLRNVSWAWYAGALFVDLFILATMLDNLVFRPRIKPTVSRATLNGVKRVPPSRGRTLSNRLLHTSAIPLVVQSLVLALFAARSNGLQYLVYVTSVARARQFVLTQQLPPLGALASCRFAFFAPKVYIVSLLATLNSRSPHGVNGALDPVETFTLDSLKPRVDPNGPFVGAGLGGPGGSGPVRVIVEHDERVDHGDSPGGPFDDEVLFPSSRRARARAQPADPTTTTSTDGSKIAKDLEGTNRGPADGTRPYHVGFEPLDVMTKSDEAVIDRQA